MELNVTTIYPGTSRLPEHISSLGIFESQGKQMVITRCIHSGQPGWLITYQPGGIYFVAVADMIAVVAELEAGEKEVSTHTNLLEMI